MSLSSSAPYLSLTVSQAHFLPKPTLPEVWDHHTFDSLLDHRAKYQSSQLAVGFPQLAGKECLTFTFAQLAALSLSIARQIKRELHSFESADRQPVFAILGPSGPHFLLNVLACWRLGTAILPIALGTSADGAANLLKVCNADLLLYSNSQVDLVKKITSCETSKEKMLKAEWFDWTSKELDDDDALEPLHQVAPSDTLVIFHSSGSSGIPKPLPQLHKFWSTSLLNAQGKQFAAFTTTPLFHGGLSDFFRSVQASATIYFYPWYLQVSPTTEHILKSVEDCKQDIHYFLSVPFILEMLIKSEEGIKMLQRMDLVSTGGAPLSELVGDFAVQERNIKLVSRLGSSECGFLMSSFRDFEIDKEWSWLRLPDELGQSWLRFEAAADEKDIFELIVSSKWPSKQLSNRPDGSFATGDLYERHPRYTNRWRYKRRSDDSIVMVNGKKISGSLIESKINASPLIDEVIVFGANRPLLGAIVFASENTQASTLRQELKPFLLEINRTLPSHGRITLEMIHIGDSVLCQSLPRSSKGTLQKGLALEQLQGLIDELYSHFQEGEAPRTEEKKDLREVELRQWLKGLVDDVCDGNIGLNDDFYQSGIDSIMVARIRAGIHQGLSLQGFKLESNDVYKHPTITLLSQFIDSRGQDQGKEIKRVMQDMVKRNSSFSPAKAKDDSQKPGGSTTVLLTGATGALGSRILYELVEGEQKVDSVICLVRAKDSLAARDRVKSALHDRGLKIPDKKIDCVTNLWELGLKKDVIGAARLSIVHVSIESLFRFDFLALTLSFIQSAWIVNFNLQVESFEQDCISGEFTFSESNDRKVILSVPFLLFLQGSRIY